MYEDDEKLKSIIHNAKILNLNVNEIKVLYCIHKAGEISQRDIERRADLRQSEVSLAIKHLSLMEMLNCDSIQNAVKGRPQKYYSLKKSMMDYFSAINKQKENEWIMVKLALDDMGQQFAD
ncbi:MAG: MarR family transcriptional regulator [Methanoregula sp.]|nr:MarR family transcriptional regulator [Methanoregula sp.]